MGSLLGINVRDVVCFGIWVMVRRYIMKELFVVLIEFMIIGVYVLGSFVL